MEDMDVRNQLLTELIDKMHDRLAEKAYPSEKPKEEEIMEAVQEETAPKEEMGDDEVLSDEDLEALMPAEDAPSTGV